VGEEYTLSRGSAVTDFLKNFRNQNIEKAEMLDPGTSQELTEGMEA